MTAGKQSLCADSPCAVEGCQNSSGYQAGGRRGWCGTHYARWRKNGDPLLGARVPADHGTHYMYSRRGCRCEACKAANAASQRAFQRKRGCIPVEVSRAVRWAEAQARDNHGTETRYSFGCRCAKCREASRLARAERRSRRVAA